MKYNTLKTKIPNLLTTINLMCGMIAILLIIHQQNTNIPNIVTIVFFLVLLGAICDFLDGFLARKFGSCSKIGELLDSFADLVTFGLAPMVLLNYILLDIYWIFGLLLSCVFVVTGVYRLVRYHVKKLPDVFLGLPITIAGLMQVFFSFLLYQLHQVNLLFIISLTLLLSLLMVSRLKIRRIIFEKMFTKKTSYSVMHNTTKHISHKSS